MKNEQNFVDLLGYEQSMRDNSKSTDRVTTTALLFPPIA